MGWQEKKTLEGLSYYYNPSSEDITWEKPDELQTPQERELSKGEWTWVPDPKDLWQPARRTGTNGDGSVDCQTENGKTVTVPASGVMNGAQTGGRKVKVEFWPLKRSTLVFTEEDMVMLDQLNEAMIITNLRRRYENDMLYTWVGAARSVLVSVNPYKMLPLYGNDKIDLYRSKPPNTKLDPHTFDIANDSYNSLLFENKNQSILISGESGAGKTVCTKQCLSFLARVAGSERNVEERIIVANPLLEAFGNAQTIRNNNSSRFGKWIQIYFDPMQRAITGAEIINYLLEKSRLVYQQRGERNYHIFYQLTKDSSAMREYGLDSPQNYRYTNQSGTYDAKDIDDVEGYQETMTAMNELDFSSEDTSFLLGVAAGILKLGNSEFKEKKEKGGVTGSSLKDSGPARAAAQLLGVSEDGLEKVLCYRSISVRGQRSVIPLDPEKARASCDSLAMGIYGRLFDWLVRKINVALKGDDSDNKSVFIGILDIFGFEIFDQNSFEQLCINFANEKLQQQFNKTTFKEEEALYISEGIKYKHIEFIDNQVVLDLIEKTPKGILPMLDDECLIPEGSDMKFMNKVEDVHKKNDKFQTDKHRKLENSYNFEVVHYAGVVRYNGDGFIVKNRDSMFSDQHTLCSQSSLGNMKELFPAGTSNANTKSLSYQFRGQLQNLMDSLYKTESRYIRCIKPNGRQVPDSFESGMVVDQLRYSGVFEAVEIRKQGFPFRYKYNQFACKYSCINRGHRYSKNKRDYKGLCQEILSTSKYDFSEAVFGNTMVLYKTAEHRMLTLLRELALETLIPKMQGVMRGALAREMRRRCVALQASLQEALDVANDIDMLTRAIDDVEPTLDAFLNIFPGYYPVNLKEAKEHREALKQWKVLEKTFDRLNAVERPSVDQFEEMKAAVAEAKRILNVPQTDKQKDLFEAAKVHVIYMEIVLQEELIDNDIGRFSNLSNYSGLKPILEYTKKKKRQELRCSWEKSKIPAALTAAIGATDKPGNKLAVKVFGQIMQFMGDKKAKDPVAVCVEIIASVEANPVLKDEVYCQLIKQTTNNTNPQGTAEMGWDLFAVFVSSFLAGESLEPFILAHLRNAPGGIGGNLKSTYHNLKFGGGRPQHVSAGSYNAIVGNAKSQGRSKFSVMS